MRAYREGTPCPKCHSGTTTSLGECLSCGALWGATFLCPHCETHAKIAKDKLVGSVCEACGEARIELALPSSAYDALRMRVRTYRRWPARSMFYVPFAALILSLIATMAVHGGRATARQARQDFVAEHGPDMPPPRAFVLELTPEAPATFAFVLLLTGALGIAVYIGVAIKLRRRIRREVSALARPR